MNKEFQNFIKKFKWVVEKKTESTKDGPIEYDNSMWRYKNWCFHGDDIPSLDFNREICKPGQSSMWPDGVIGLRVDSDFWVVGIIPYKFLNVPLQEVIAACWPKLVKDASFEKDVEYNHDGSGGFGPNEKGVASE